MACDQLANIAKSRLVIMESMLIKTRRILTLKIVEKVPRSRLVQIKDACQAGMDQYAEEISKIPDTFLIISNNFKRKL